MTLILNLRTQKKNMKARSGEITITLKVYQILKEPMEKGTVLSRMY